MNVGSRPKYGNAAPDRGRPRAAHWWPSLETKSAGCRTRGVWPAYPMEPPAKSRKYRPIVGHTSNRHPASENTYMHLIVRARTTQDRRCALTRGKRVLAAERAFQGASSRTAETLPRPLNRAAHDRAAASFFSFVIRRYSAGEHLPVVINNVRRAIVSHELKATSVSSHGSGFFRLGMSEPSEHRRVERLGRRIGFLGRRFGRCVCDRVNR